MHPDQEYHVEYSPIGNHVRFETLQVKLIMTAIIQNGGFSVNSVNNYSVALLLPFFSFVIPRHFACCLSSGLEEGSVL